MGRLLETLQKAYRYVHLADPDIGTQELANLLCDELCEIMGDEGFKGWLQALMENDNAI